MNAANLPKVLIIGLGGTISMKRGDGPGLRGALSAADIVASIPEVGMIASLETLDHATGASAELTLVQVAAVAGAAKAALVRGVDGVVVVQGTDTLEDTAFALDLMLDGEGAVVVTGALRGADAAGADGPANLVSALRVAASPLGRGLGVVVVMNDEIHAARYAHKGHTFLPSAFSSPGAGPLGVVAGRKVKLMLRPAVRSPTLEWTGESPLVCVLPVHGGAGPEIIAATASLRPAGLVVAGLGGGHTPAAWAEPLGRLSREIPVVLASQVGSGPVLEDAYGYPGGEIDLLGRGLVPAGALTAGKARTLLALLIGAGADRATIKEAFGRF